MIPPIWQTPAGTLGTIPEGKFYKLALRATAPASNVSFILLAGALPPGIQVKVNGTIEGVPEAVALTQGIPQSVDQAITSKFTVRAFVTNGNETAIADRTFTLTITGQDLPRFNTPPGLLGAWLDSTRVNIPIDVEDIDSDELTLSVISGQLPPGLSIDGTNIVGIIEPEYPVVDLLPNNSNLAELKAISTLYEFGLEVFDGKESARRSFLIYVHSRDALPELPEEYTLGIDPNDVQLKKRPPFIISLPSLGRFRHDNFFATKIETVDFNGDQVEVVLAPGSSISGITQGDSDPVVISSSNWLWGWISEIAGSEITQTFELEPRKKNYPDIVGNSVVFSITFYSDADAEVTWVSPEHLGTVLTGVASALKVEAISRGGYELTYELDPEYPGTGTPSLLQSLPEGLTVLPNGAISGRPSFKQFTLDQGTTTFDTNLSTRREVNPVTFDRTYKFSIRAKNASGSINVSKVFSILVVDSAAEQSENVYLEALPSIEYRAQLKQLLDAIPDLAPNSIYRPGDSNFGIASALKIGHIFGTAVASLDEYAQALEQSHYTKQVILSMPKTAVAMNSRGEIVYEVVYSEVIDPLVTASGKSVSRRITLPAVANRPLDNAGRPIFNIYPNSFYNMRQRVESSIGLVNQVPPLWMRSKQENGAVLGLVLAWPIAFTVPGKSKELLYKIVDSYGTFFENNQFTVERYVIDKSLTFGGAVESSQTNYNDKYAIFSQQGLLR